MSQRIEVSEIGLVNRYYMDFPPENRFTTDSSGALIIGTSNKNFISSRVSLVSDHILGIKDNRYEMSQAYLAEELVRVALKNPLEERGFFLHLAPQNIESGVDKKGVDFLITDSSQMIYLGIDLKLKKGRSRFNRDGSGWCPNLQSPFIYLKMGNWSLETRENPDVNIRQWIQEYTRPKLKTTGKIPRVYELRQYIVPRVIRTLSGYIEALNKPEDKFYKLYTPEDRQSLIILKNKLSTVNSLFSSISHDYHLED